jgi:hypothetical protein
MWGVHVTPLPPLCPLFFSDSAHLAPSARMTSLSSSPHAATLLSDGPRRPLVLSPGRPELLAQLAYSRAPAARLLTCRGGSTEGAIAASSPLISGARRAAPAASAHEGRLLLLDAHDLALDAHDGGGRRRLGEVQRFCCSSAAARRGAAVENPGGAWAGGSPLPPPLSLGRIRPTLRPSFLCGEASREATVARFGDRGGVLLAPSSRIGLCTPGSSVTYIHIQHALETYICSTDITSEYILLVANNSIPPKAVLTQRPG